MITKFIETSLQPLADIIIHDGTETTNPYMYELYWRMGMMLNWFCLWYELELD